MSLAEYRATTKILGEKSALFEHKKEIFEAIGMGLSHEQIHHFLTTQKGLKISVRAVSKWIKTHKKQSSKPIIPSFESQKPTQNQANNGVQDKKEVTVEPKEAQKSDADLLNDPKYALIRKAAADRVKFNQMAWEAKQNEDNDR